jgi:protein-arginine kinase activator protein McsA
MKPNKWIRIWDLIEEEERFPIIDISNEELLEKAIQEENYEEAARLHFKIKNNGRSN